MSELKEKVFSIVANVMDVSVTEITMDSSPDTIKGWDSLKQMNLILALEEEFGVQFDDEQIVDMMKVSRILEILSEVL